MSKTKNTLAIRKYFNSGLDLELDVLSFMIQDRVKNSTRVVRLIVNRLPDKHSTRLGMFAQLRSRGLGFEQVVLIRDTYADDGKFISRVMYVFPGVAVESSYMRGTEEELTFVSGGMTEISISKTGVTVQ